MRMKSTFVAQQALASPTLAESSPRSCSPYGAFSEPILKLTETCHVLRKLGAAGHGIEISVEMQKLCLKFKTTKILISTLSVEVA